VRSTEGNEKMLKNWEQRQSLGTAKKDVKLFKDYPGSGLKTQFTMPYAW